MNKLGLGLLSITLFLAACEDPAANKPKAQTTAPTSATTANSAANLTIKGTALPISPENSKVEFTGSKVTGKHEGGFKSFSGTIDLVGEKPEDSQVAVDIEMKSAFSDADGLTKHLQSGDFFETDKYPKSSFISTKIVPDTAKGVNNYMVTGDLEMRGVKKSVTFPATINVTPTDVSVDSEFAINRKEFGIAYAGKADDLIRDDVVVRLNLKSLRKK